MLPIKSLEIHRQFSSFKILCMKKFLIVFLHVFSVTATIETMRQTIIESLDNGNIDKVADLAATILENGKFPVENLKFR